MYPERQSFLAAKGIIGIHVVDRRKHKQEMKGVCPWSIRAPPASAPDPALTHVRASPLDAKHTETPPPFSRSHKFTRHARQTRQRTYPARQTLRRANPARERLHVDSAKPSLPASTIRVSLAAIVPARVAAATIPAPGGPRAMIPHLGEIDAELARELVQHAAADERHDDHEKHLVWVALGVAPEFAQEMAQFAVQVGYVAVAGGALVAGCRGAVRGGVG